MPIGSKPTSLEDLKTKRGAGGSGSIYWIGKEPVVVRFLTEPIGFYRYREVWNGKTSVPFTDDMVEGRDFDQKPTVRWLAKVVLRDDKGDDRMVCMKLPQSVVNLLVTRFERYETLMDRDYELSKTGEGMSGTTYMVDPEPPSKMNFGKYDPDSIDYEEVLEEALSEALDAKSSRKLAASNRKGKTSQPAFDEEEDESLPVEDEPSEEEMGTMDWKELNDYAREVGVTLTTRKRNVLIEAILEARE